MPMKQETTDFFSGAPSAEPIQLHYTLTADDIFNALKTSRIYRKNFIKAIIESSVLAGLVILFGVWWMIWGDGNAMIFCIACACLIGVVWAVVLFSIRSTCNRMVTGEQIDLIIDSDWIHVSSGTVQSWRIPLDGSIVCEEKNGILILYTGQSEWMLLPLQYVAEQQRDQVRNWILKNTKQIEK